MNKSVLITGQGGYIGTLLVPLLLKKNLKSLVDRFIFGKNYFNKIKSKILKSYKKILDKLQKKILKILIV